MRCICVVIVSLLVASSTLADTWPQFRGVTGNGVSTETGLPTTWSEDSGVAWSVELPGRANSSPAVTAKRIDVTTQTEDGGLWVISFDRESGKLLRRTKVGSGKLVAKGPANLYAHRHNAATPSPIADDSNIWAFFGSGLLVCVDATSGNVKWKHDMVKEYGPYDITFGMGSTPRLHGNHIYVSCLTKGPSYVVAFDKETGEEAWKSPRRLPASDDGPDAYTTPSLHVTDSGVQLLVAGSDHVNAYDVKSGKQLWVSDGLKVSSPYGRVIAAPFVADGVVVATSANPAGAGLGRVLGIRAGGSGDISKTHRLWEHTKSTPDSSTPVAIGGNVYLCADNGVANCLDLKSGEVRWTKRLPQGPYHASLVAGDGKVYFLSTTGTCTVIQAGNEAKVLATNKLPGLFYATPAISDGILYLRSYDRLYAIKGS